MNPYISVEKHTNGFIVFKETTEKGIKNGQVFHPLRVAVSGRTTGPSLFHMMEVMGKAEVLRRIKAALARFF